MRLVMFHGHGGPRLGSLHDGRIVDLNIAYEAMLAERGDLRARQKAEAIVPADSRELLQGGDESLSEAAAAADWALSRGNAEHRGMPIVRAESDVRLAAPVVAPEKIICVAHNYHDFLKEIGIDPHEEPRIFAKFANSVCSWDQPVIRPKMSRALGYEVELAFIVGKRCHNVSEADAYDHIAGYTTANDVSASDLTQKDVQNLRGKSFDTFGILGPHLATRDEVGDPHNLDVALRVNGETLQTSNTRELVHNIPQLLSFCSQVFTLEPGDVVMTGTPGGLAKDRNPPTYMNPGDVMETEVEGLGICRNEIMEEA